MTDFLWPIIALGTWCFGYATGVAWAAAFRPTTIKIVTRIVTEEIND
jgi:hypothetical protein